MPFIVFEGGEAAGKTTQIDLLAKHLLSLPGIQLEQTREPGGTPLAEGIRALFKAERPDDEPLPITEAFLVMAARAQHVRKRLRPALARGAWILSDRYLDSSYVYQHFAGGLPRATVDALGALAIDALLPDLTFVLVLDPTEAAARAAQRLNSAGDRLDSKGSSFFLRIHEGFESLIKEAWPYPCGRVPLRVPVDARGGPDEVFGRILAALSLHFPDLIPAPRGHT